MTSRQSADLPSDELEELIADFSQCLSEGHFFSAKQLLAGVVAIVGIEDPETYFGRGLLALEEHQDFVGAQKLLEHAVRLDPDFADARHALGALFETRGNFRGMVREWTAVLRLDSAADGAEGDTPAEALDHITQVAEAVLKELPAQFREALARVPIVLESRPHPAMVEEGFDPRALGLFEGTEQANSGDIELAVDRPTRIVLFTANLLASFPDPERLDEEIEVTLLHEIGHYFDLDEGEVEALGLG